MTTTKGNGWAGRGDLADSLVLIFPLILAYGIGAALTGHVNGVDLVTRGLYRMCDGRTGYLILHAAIALGFLLWIRRERRWQTLRLETWGPVVVEAAIYAVALCGLVTLLIHHVLGLGLSARSVVSAFGAGVHEELVFRLGLMCGVVAMLGRTRVALPIALVTTSLLFAAAHHVGPGGEPWSVHAFAFRSVAGAAFGAICWYRSLAHAVYAHVIYDLLVAASG